MTIRFLHPATRVLLSGTIISRHVQTGEILVTRTDDGSRLYVRSADVR